MKKLVYKIFALIFLSLSVPPLFAKTIVFLHSNDTHGIYKPFKIKTKGGDRWVGGMAATYHYINAVREKEDHVFFIDTGDLMTGTPATELEYKNVTGGWMIEFLNKLKCDVWCFGNHDFDLGPENALGLARLGNFPTVMSNIVYKDTGKLLPVKPYHISRISGMNVGFIGVMSEKFLIEVLKERIASLDVLPGVSTLQSRIPELDAKTDLVVVLFHGKYHEAVEVAKNVRGIDIMLVASEDGRLDVVDGVLIQSTFGHQRSLGYLKVEVADGRVVDYEGKQVWLWADGQLKPSPQIETLVKRMDGAIGSDYARVVGEAKRDHNQKGESVENALGNWITDAMRWKTGTDIGFQNTGGIRHSLLTGPITKGDIFEVSPFRNSLVVFELTAQEIKKLLEHDVEKDWDRLQISGMSYEYYPKDTKPLGERIVRITVNGEILAEKGMVLNPDKVYSVVSNNYLVGQAKDKYFGFPVGESKNTGLMINQILLSWLEKHRFLDYGIEGRIVKIDN